MRPVLAMTCVIAVVLSGAMRKKKTVFQKEQQIFSSKFNITHLTVPFENSNFVTTEVKDMPTIFFTVSDPNLEGGSCIYVLEGFAAYEILEGGRDTTTGYGSDPTVYFGSNKGIYKYIPESLGVMKFGSFHDDIKQIQKAKDIDVIYTLNSDNKIYKVENNGTVRKRVSDILCATEFVLDTSNNIYYLDCDDGMPRIQRQDGTSLGFVSTLFHEHVKTIKLIRPAFIMEESIPFFGDKGLYFLYSNGTCEKLDFHLDEVPSAFSVDSALYIVAAMDGKLYEFNVMDMILGSMFGVSSEWPSDIATVVLAFVETTRKHLGLSLPSRSKA
ncbi:uncharacterized protein LOC128681134 [Plodia interpunctella]|uniref:uncharacterized protein LOC128681134 n=1 Tax=Plodia interpunctella TaxID=58824 RepID=UPI00236825F8|nr:uncharacterized protein LOC128681134 [Plodia interpunctella]XP_053620750.1 uncharacterized protein LOC128681134 [Plodia interpunctella]XP_053620751.1 uncharacterized protein LOC128681134 [Plodia interpunctella]